MWKYLRRLLAGAGLLVALTILIPLAGLGYGFLTTSGPGSMPSGEAARPAISDDLRRDIAGYARTEESTFLTYPEWAIVYAARDYAAFTGGNFPSRFPFLAYAGRFWQDYALMIRASAAYPFNVQNHLMLLVIGTSDTIELAVQALYENTAGRLTEALAGWRSVPEDAWQAKVAADYAAFLDQTPWYRFDYAQARAGLWDTAPAGGLAAIRSWERKLAFGAADTIKQGYAALIASGLSATADPALLDIHVWAAGPVAGAVAGEPDTRIERDLGAEGAVFVTRRYQVFTGMIPRLIEKGVRFVEVGGNRTIFLTALAKEDIAAPPGARAVLSYRLPAQPAVRRLGYAVDVGRLHAVLPQLAAAGALLEHVYDY